MSYRDQEYKTIIVTFEEPNIGIVQINRPKAFNAVNETLLDETYGVLEGMHLDPEVRAIIVTGNENAFAAGADIMAVKDFNAFQAHAYIDKVHKVLFMMEDNSKPIIAAINGLALGGGLELVMACDIRIAGEAATFGMPEINLGIFPGAGGTQRFPRNASICQAKLHIFTGEFFGAAVAEKIGLINMIVPPAEVMDQARKMAKKLARKSPVAMRFAKQNINNSMNVDIKAGCQAEQKSWSMLFSGTDQKEGMYAFIEKRKATFTQF